MLREAVMAVGDHKSCIDIGTHAESGVTMAK